MANDQSTGTGAAHPEFDEWWKAHQQEFLEGATAASCAYVAWKAGQQEHKEALDNLRQAISELKETDHERTCSSMGCRESSCDCIVGWAKKVLAGDYT